MKQLIIQTISIPPALCARRRLNLLDRHSCGGFAVRATSGDTQKHSFKPKTKKESSGDAKESEPSAKIYAIEHPQIS